MNDKKKTSKNASVFEPVDIDDVTVSVSEESFITEDVFADVETSVTEPSVSSTEEEVLTVSEISADSPKNKKSFYLTIYDFVSIIMTSFIVVAIVFSFVFRVVGVDGQSMTNTLQHGDMLLTVNKSEYVQGDIVVITQETYFQKPLIKRVIAVGGQTVDIDYATATVYVDGVALDEPYVRESFMIKKGEYREFPYQVPEGHLFCMGDNRNGSSDSRTDIVGPIDEREILGKAVVRVMPFGDFDIYAYE